MGWLVQTLQSCVEGLSPQRVVCKMAFVSVFRHSLVGYQVEVRTRPVVLHIAVSFSVKYGMVSHAHISINLVQGICKNIFSLHLLFIKHSREKLFP